MSDVAIAHKDYAVAGGGERVAERLGLAFDAPVYAGFVNDRKRADLRADVRGLWNDGLVNRILRRGGLSRSIAYRYLWQHTTALDEYETIIHSGNEPLWYTPREAQTVVAYTHSTPRLMYDLDGRLRQLHEAKADPGRIGRTVGAVKRTLNRILTDKQRRDYHHVVDYPDLFVANSDLVAARLRTYWNVAPERIRVVYPPVAVDEYGPRHASHDGEFYLSVNRLDEWKAIDEIVDAFAGLDGARLLVAGDGPARADLEARASDTDTIEFLGYVPDDEKKRLLAAARGVVYNPLNEDFGIVPIEALASGTPVISVRDGFQRYQLDDGKTAIMYDRSYADPQTTVRNLRRAVRRFEADGVARDATERQDSVAYYRVARFEREMERAVEVARERASVRPTKRVRAMEGDGVADVLEGPVEPAAARTDGGGE